MLTDIISSHACDSFAIRLNLWNIEKEDESVLLRECVLQPSKCGNTAAHEIVRWINVEPQRQCLGERKLHAYTRLTPPHAHTRAALVARLCCVIKCLLFCGNTAAHIITHSHACTFTFTHTPTTSAHKALVARVNTDTLVISGNG